MFEINKYVIISCFSVLSSLYAQNSKKNQNMVLNNYERLDLDNWKLVWQDEFDYSDKDLEKQWVSQNGPTGDFVICSRWRENAEVINGVLELKVKKEQKAGEDWTCGNVWTKATFGYGYFEARYKYVACYGANNSFWLWPKFRLPEGEKACEVDINEGHFPNVINTNIHNWTDKDTAPNGKVTHESDQIHHTLTGEPVQEIKLEEAVTTKKLRLISNTPSSIQISEFRIFKRNMAFPNWEKALGNKNINLAAQKDVKIITNGNNSGKLESKPNFATDNKMETRWVSKGNSGEKWIEFQWTAPQSINAIQFLNGCVQADGLCKNLITDYKIQIWKNNTWEDIYEYDVSKTSNFGEEYHTYGLEWDEDYFKFYFDGKLYRKVRNKVCFSKTNILLSLALLKQAYAGPVTDDLDGKSMKIDYVRYYKPNK
ncbi:family 16 glycosylhydrolase [uncultured Algibacter sp.]|uniref:family 16 glycosylhydrolase n=1 Tax=uncultured Algibacter sp. TaxID=298659 RepID=UPI0026230F83|nr:family 16 glycosylhydrolase [uncultured Algibacter sp.]